MDPIVTFLHAKQKVFSLPVLLATQSRLISLQSTAKRLTYEDVIRAVTDSAGEMDSEDITAHSALFLEACLFPKINPAGQITMQLKHEILLEDQYALVKSLLFVMHVRMKEEQWPAVAQFKANAAGFFDTNLQSASSSSTEDLYRGGNFDSSSKELRDAGELSKSVTTKPVDQAPTHKPGSVDDERLYPSACTENSMDEEMTEPPSPPSGIVSEIERNEGIVRFLAQVRKSGMDILFPQNVYDKVLACIFVAVKSGATLAHREIIDMVITVKDSRAVTELDTVSKTKVRGILALLKHGELLTTRGLDGEPIRLVLTPGINTFRDFRDRHDMFLTRFMVEHQITMPPTDMAEVVWQYDVDAKSERLANMERIISLLKVYFSSTYSNRSYVNRKSSERRDPRSIAMGLVPNSNMRSGPRPAHYASNRSLPSDTFAYDESVTDSYGYRVSGPAVEDGSDGRGYAPYQQESSQRYRQPPIAGSDPYVHDSRGYPPAAYSRGGVDPGYYPQRNAAYQPQPYQQPYGYPRAGASLRRPTFEGQRYGYDAQPRYPVYDEESVPPPYRSVSGRGHPGQPIPASDRRGYLPPSPHESYDAEYPPQQPYAPHLLHVTARNQNVRPNAPTVSHFNPHGRAAFGDEGAGFLSGQSSQSAWREETPSSLSFGDSNSLLQEHPRDNNHIFQLDGLSTDLTGALDYPSSRDAHKPSEYSLY